jgi:hypothetical protein
MLFNLENEWQPEMNHFRTRAPNPISVSQNSELVMAMGSVIGYEPDSRGIQRFR